MTLKSSIHCSGYGYLADAARGLKALLLLLLFIAASQLPATPPELVTVDELKALRDRSGCVVIHPWATWCKLCLEELPELVPKLKSPDFKTVVLDLSEPQVQKLFSSSWSQTLRAPFVMYRKGKQPQEQYRQVLDAEWDGSLPRTMLFRDGKKEKTWVGKVGPTFLDEVRGLCASKAERTPSRQKASLPR